MCKIKGVKLGIKDLNFIENMTRVYSVLYLLRVA